MLSYFWTDFNESVPRLGGFNASIVYLLCSPVQPTLTSLRCNVWMALFRPLGWWVQLHISLVFLLFGESGSFLPQRSKIHLWNSTVLEFLAGVYLWKWYIMTGTFWSWAHEPTCFWCLCLFVWSSIMLYCNTCELPLQWPQTTRKFNNPTVQLWQNKTAVTMYSGENRCGQRMHGLHNIFDMQS